MVWSHHLVGAALASDPLPDGMLTALGVSQDPDACRLLALSDRRTLALRSLPAVRDSILGRAPGPHDGADAPLAAAHDRDIGFAADLVGDRIQVTAADDLLGIEDDVRTLCRLLLALLDPASAGSRCSSATGGWQELFPPANTDPHRGDEKRSSHISCWPRRYREQVVQVSFNAWHYLDADLWASIADRLYRAGGRADRAGPQGARSQIFEQLASTSETRERAAAEREQAEKELNKELTKRLDDRESALVNECGITG